MIIPIYNAKDRLRPEGPRARLCSERGDTIIEVLISAMILAIIVVASFNGFSAITKASALGRARSQAQALAEQDQERLRSEPINAIEALSGSTTTRTVKLNGTTYTIATHVELISETGSSLCTTSNPSNGVYRTTSEVTWWGGKGDHRVVTTSSIPPPPGAALLVQFEGAEKGQPVPEVETSLTGPGSGGPTYNRQSTASGCVIFGPFETGGEFKLNAHRAGYVDPNGYTYIAEDPSVQTIWNLLINTISKTGFRLAPAGSLTVNLVTARPPAAQENWSAVTQAPNVVIDNSGMHPQARTLSKTNGKYETLSSESNLFPFTYAVFAGTCEANNPATVSGALVTEATVPPGGQATATVTMPDLIVRVYNGTEITDADMTAHPIIVASDSDCTPHLVIEESEAETLTSSSKIKEQGQLARPGVPAGIYTVCTEWTTGGKTFSARAEHVPVPLAGSMYTEVTLLHGINVEQSNVKLEGPCPR